MATKSDFIVKSGLKVTTDATVTGNVTAAFLSGNGVNVTSVDAVTVGGNTVSEILSSASGTTDTAYSNAVSYADTIAGTAYSNAVSTASSDATSKAATAYSNATSYAATIAGTAYSNAVSTASSDATSKAATAYSNATSYAATIAATAYSNAVSYAASNTYVNSTFAPTADPTFTGNATFDTSTLFVDGTNNRVGIGTSSPGSLLTVDTGNGLIDHGLGGDYPAITYRNGSGAWFHAGKHSSSDYFYIGNGATPITNINFVIASNGNVGIATTTPGYKLEVNGSLNTTSFYIGGTQVTSTAAELNVLDGITATVTELNYTDGVTSNIQTQLNAKLASSSYTAADVLSKLLTVDGSGSGLDADTLDGVQGSSFLRSDAVDYGVTLELNSGSTYDPSSTGAGTDTATDVALSIYSGSRIVGHYAGYIRSLLEWNTSSDITIGQGGTTLIGGINLLPGSSGDAKVNGNRILTVADEGSGNGLDADTLDGVQGSSYLRSDTADTFTGTLTVDGTAYIGDSAQRVKIYDDGNAHIHSTSGNLWINAEDGSEIKINAQYNGNVQLGNGTGYGYAPASLRAPTFYDSDNSSYYINPITTNSSAFYAQVNDTVGDTSTYGIVLDYNGSGSDTLTADRNHWGMYIDMDISATGGDTNNEYRAYGQYIDLYNTGDPDLLYGNYMYVHTAHTSGTISSLNAAYNYALIQSTGTVSYMYGARNNAYVSFTGAQSLNTGYGSYNYFYHGAALTGTTSAAYGAVNEVEINSGTITTAYGTRSSIDYNGGTIGTGYLYYGDYQGDPGTRWGVYITGEGSNYFSGNVGIGTTSAGQKLTVAGTVESTSGGFKFPDGTTQTTASSASVYTGSTSTETSYPIGHVIILQTEISNPAINASITPRHVFGGYFSADTGTALSGTWRCRGDYQVQYASKSTNDRWIVVVQRTA